MGDVSDLYQSYSILIKEAQLKRLKREIEDELSELELKKDEHIKLLRTKISDELRVLKKQRDKNKREAERQQHPYGLGEPNLSDFDLS